MTMTKNQKASIFFTTVRASLRAGTAPPPEVRSTFLKFVSEWVKKLPRAGARFPLTEARGCEMFTNEFVEKIRCFLTT